MPRKKSVKKKKTTKKSKTSTSVPAKTSSDLKIEKVLVENFVALQKVMTNLSGKFDNLANQISKLLDIFEISAKSLAKKDFDLGQGKVDEELNKKIDMMLDQNKTIARGLTLLHEPESRQGQVPMPSPPRPPQLGSQPRPPQGVPPANAGLPKTGAPQNISGDVINQQKPKDPRQTVNMSGYEKSMPFLGESPNQVREDKKKNLTEPKDSGS